MVSMLSAAACVGPQQATTALSSPSGHAGVPPTSLHVTGSLHASTNPAGGANQCLLNQPNRGQLSLATSGMSLSGGQALKVEMTLRPSPGTYSAVVPTGGGGTPVRVERLAYAPDGGITGRWMAISGTVTVDRADNVGGPETVGIVSGSVDSQLTRPDGAAPIHVYGTWGCSFSN